MYQNNTYISNIIYIMILSIIIILQIYKYMDIVINVSIISQVLIIWPFQWRAHCFFERTQFTFTFVAINYND